MLFLRHYATKIDPGAPAESWLLDDRAEDATRRLISSNRLTAIRRVFTSPETKALVTAREISEFLGVPLVEMPEMAEVDRSAAGFVADDYREVVRAYLAGKPDPKYPFESMDSVAARIRAWFTQVNGDGRQDLCLCHGLWLSILVSDYFGTRCFDFWDRLGFGELLELDLVRLRDQWARRD